MFSVQEKLIPGDSIAFDMFLNCYERCVVLTRVCIAIW